MIVVAAVKIYMYDKGIDSLIPVHRHRDARFIMGSLGFTDYDYRYGIEGFLTDKGEFLDRRAAADHAYECGQLVETAEEPRIDKLMSEDLWQEK